MKRNEIDNMLYIIQLFILEFLAHPLGHINNTIYRYIYIYIYIYTVIV